MSLHAIDPNEGAPGTPPAPGAPESAAERAARRRAHVLLLRRTCERLADDDALWFDACLDAVATSDAAREPRTFELAFGLAPRRLGRTPLAADEAARRALREAGDALLPGWHAALWRVDEAARVLLLLAAGEAAVPALLERALRHADLGERLTLYRALPLLPVHPTVHECARQGLRTNMRAVFEAIAHANPWPARHLDEAGWNQMVLKALFVDSALAPIRGLDARVNAELATMLIDYAHERRAAARPIPDALWRALGPYATPARLAPFLPDTDSDSGDALAA